MLNAAAQRSRRWYAAAVLEVSKSAPLRQRRWRTDRCASQFCSSSTYHARRRINGAVLSTYANRFLVELTTHKHTSKQQITDRASPRRRSRTRKAPDDSCDASKTPAKCQASAADTAPKPGDLRPPDASDFCAGAAATTTLTRARPAGLPRPSKSLDLAREGSVPSAESSTAGVRARGRRERQPCSRSH